jgi:hypothetical protein
MLTSALLWTFWLGGPLPDGASGRDRSYQAGRWAPTCDEVKERKSCKRLTSQNGNESVCSGQQPSKGEEGNCMKEKNVSVSLLVFWSKDAGVGRQ